MYFPVLSCREHHHVLEILIPRFASIQKMYIFVQWVRSSISQTRANWYPVKCLVCILRDITARRVLLFTFLWLVYLQNVSRKFLIKYACNSVSNSILLSWINRTTTNPIPTSTWPLVKLVTANTKCWTNDRTRYTHPYSNQGNRYRRCPCEHNKDLMIIYNGISWSKI
jgi:hypothetical protein